MGLRPAVSVPPISPEEMDQMISRAGLVLNHGQIGDLVVAWRQVAQLSALIPRDRPLADDLALVFRLPPPQPRKRAAAKSRAKPAARPSVKAAAKKPAKPKRPAGRETAPKRR
jgi:hypothetical protein